MYHWIENAPVILCVEDTGFSGGLDKSRQAGVKTEIDVMIGYLLDISRKKLALK